MLSPPFFWAVLHITKSTSIIQSNCQSLFRDGARAERSRWMNYFWVLRVAFSTHQPGGLWLGGWRALTPVSMPRNKGVPTLPSHSIVTSKNPNALPSNLSCTQKNTNSVIAGPLDDDSCCWPTSALKKKKKDQGIVCKEMTQKFCLTCSINCYYMISSEWSFSGVEWSIYKWSLVLHSVFNESSVTSSCFLLKWKSCIMCLRNIPANEDVMSSVQHRPSFCVFATTRCWKLDKWYHLRHACRRDLLFGFLFLAFIWVTFIMATWLVMGNVLTPS